MEGLLLISAGALNLRVCTLEPNRLPPGFAKVKLDRLAMEFRYSPSLPDIVIVRQHLTVVHRQVTEAWVSVQQVHDVLARSRRVIENTKQLLASQQDPWENA